MATDQKSLREKMAEQLGDAGLQCLAQITVAASTVISNTKRLDYKDFGEDDYEYTTDVDPLVKAIKGQCSAIVDAYNTFSNGEERFTMVLKLSEILNRVDPSIEYSKKLCKTVGKLYSEKSCIGSVSGEVLKATQSMEQPKSRLQSIAFAAS